MELLEHVRGMGEAAGRVSLAALGQSQALEGSISIAASETYAAVLLPPIIAKLRTLEPGIHVEIVVSNRASDLLRREADIAIRNFRPTEPDLIAKKIGMADAILYASPAYVAKLGHPKTPYDLRHADFVSIDHAGSMIKPLNGLGLGLTGDADPGVVRVLPELEPLSFPIWLVAHRELNTSRRIRRVYDFLIAELKR